MIEPGDWVKRKSDGMRMAVYQVCPPELYATWQDDAGEVHGAWTHFQNIEPEQKTQPGDTVTSHPNDFEREMAATLIPVLRKGLDDTERTADLAAALAAHRERIVSFVASMLDDVPAAVPLEAVRKMAEDGAGWTPAQVRALVAAHLALTDYLERVRGLAARIRADGEP